MAERWRAISGYEDSYEVSDLGNVRSLDRERVTCRGRTETRKGRVLKHRHGSVSLSRDGHVVSRQVQVLVLTAFEGAPGEDQIAQFREGCTGDYRLESLCWMAPPGDLVVYQDGEEWRDVVGFEGRYQVSDQGRVRSLPWQGRGRRQAGKIKVQTLNRGGYPSVNLSSGKSGKVSMRTVARLVLTAFVEPQPENHCVCHKTFGRTNSRLENLRWGTRSSNEMDKYAQGTMTCRGVVRSDGVEYASLSIAAREVGGDKSNIQKCCIGKPGLIVKGFGWRYSDVTNSKTNYHAASP